MSAAAPYPDSVPSRTSDPVVDVAGHLRELRSVTLVALVIGVVVGVVVLVVRGFWPASYEVVATGKVGGSSVASQNQAVAQTAGAPFVALSQDQQVLDEVAKAVGLSDGAAVASHIKVSLPEAPGLVEITVSDSSEDEARKIAESLISTMDRVSVERASTPGGGGGSDTAASRLAELDDKIQKASASGGNQSQLQSLYTQRDEASKAVASQTQDQPARLTMLAVQTHDGEPVSPQPLGEAGVAAIVAAILAAEGIVLANGRLGSKVSPAWARRVARGRDVEVDSGPVEDCGLPLTTDIVRTQLLREDVTLLYLVADHAAGGREDAEVSEPATEEAASSSGSTSANASGSGSTTTAEAGARRTGGLLKDFVPAAGAEVRGRELVARGDAQWWRSVDVADVALALVVVDEGRDTKGETEEILDRLSLVDVPARLVVRESSDFSGPFGWLKI